MVLLLKKLIVTLKRGEQIIENQRQILCSLPEFEPHAAFQRLDRDQDNQITSVELLKFLRSNNVDEATENDCAQLVVYFGADPGLMYKDFIQICMPCDD